MDTADVENLDFANPGEIHEEPSPLINAIIAAAYDIERYAFATINEERWPLIRLGERQKISRIVRRLIFERDGGCCLGCGIPLTIKTAQLDHVVPWSAGGPDTSDNLRILCQPCNEERSNFRSGLDTAPRLPVTDLCANCAHLETGDEEPLPVTPRMVSAYCGYCGAVSPTFRGWLY